jgi:hypothetical protein
MRGSTQKLAAFLALVCIAPSVPARDWPAVEVRASLSSVRIGSSGASLVGRFFTPTRIYANQRFPAVLLTQSFPATAVNPSTEGSSEAAAAGAGGECEDLPYKLRSAGMSCLVLHLRGCGGSGGEVDLRGAGADVAAGLAWLRTQVTHRVGVHKLWRQPVGRWG